MVKFLSGHNLFNKINRCIVFCIVTHRYEQAPTWLVKLLITL
jgi:hypothetical protein